MALLFPGYHRRYILIGFPVFQISFYFWVYISLKQVGRKHRPFEGAANDVPIWQMSRTVEIDIRKMPGEKDLPTTLQPKNNIIYND